MGTRFLETHTYVRVAYIFYNEASQIHKQKSNGKRNTWMIASDLHH